MYLARRHSRKSWKNMCPSWGALVQGAKSSHPTWTWFHFLAELPKDTVVSFCYADLKASRNQIVVYQILKFRTIVVELRHEGGTRLDGHIYDQSWKLHFVDILDFNWYIDSILWTVLLRPIASKPWHIGIYVYRDMINFTQIWTGGVKWLFGPKRHSSRHSLIRSSALMENLPN